MDHLPQEVVLLLISYLQPFDILKFSQTSNRYLNLCRDTTIWKLQCFHDSRAEANRRRQEMLAAQDPVLAALRRAMLDTNQLHNTDSGNETSIRSPTTSDLQPVDVQTRAFVNWDPSYPDEDIDYYQEYIHRHAPMALKWLEEAKDGMGDGAQIRETLGVGLVDHPYAAAPQQAIAPLDDGSICIWNLTSSRRRGKIISRSAPNLVFAHGGGPRKSTVSNEPGAVDNVSVDSAQRKAFIAHLDQLNEIDLNTLQIVSQKAFPFPITALSKAEHPFPVTVGTLNTLHLHDVRMRSTQSDPSSPTRCELIGGTDGVGSVSKGIVSLSQPGPLSILNMSGTLSGTAPHDIWIAGRFTSLLNYDRRFWPRIKSTVFSGARLSSLTQLAEPFVPRDSDLLRNPRATIRDLQRIKSAAGATLIAAGEYKGKGSLELYGISPLPQGEDDAKEKNSGLAQTYQNRQTASRSRLLSVATHGGRLVYSDGDGNIKWVERNGVTPVRSFNLNEQPPPGSRSRSRSRSGSVSSSDSLTPPASTPNSLGTRRIDHFSQTLEETDDMLPDDIVQKIIPLGPSRDRHNRDDLLIWTGDGKLGLLGFGDRDKLGDWFDEVGDTQEEDELSRKERVYGKTMRRALERHADEARFVRGLGLGSASMS